MHESNERRRTEFEKRATEYEEREKLLKARELSVEDYKYEREETRKDKQILR